MGYKRIVTTYKKINVEINFQSGHDIEICTLRILSEK